MAGSTRNNVVFDGGLNGVSPESGNVFIDPNALDGERYKLIYTDWAGPEVYELPFTHNVGMLRGAASPDGLTWTRYYDNFLGKYCDSQNSACWDRTLGRYVVYHRATAEHASLSAGGVRIRGERRGRAVGRLESVDYRTWESTGIALQADFHDTMDTDIYNSAYARYPYSPNLHFMFPSFYRHYEGHVRGAGLHQPRQPALVPRQPRHVRPAGRARRVRLFHRVGRARFRGCRRRHAGALLPVGRRAARRREADRAGLPVHEAA